MRPDAGADGRPDYAGAVALSDYAGADALSEDPVGVEDADVVD